MIGVLAVQLGEIPCSSESIQGFVDEWQWMSFFLGHLVECSVVDTESEFAVFFLDKHYCRWLSRSNFSNPSSLLVLLEVPM